MINMLTDAQRSFLCQVINHYSDGGHPEASPQTLEFFIKGFAVRCLAKMLGDPSVTPQGEEMAMETLKALGRGPA